MFFQIDYLHTLNEGLLKLCYVTVRSRQIQLQIPCLVSLWERPLSLTVSILTVPTFSHFRDFCRCLISSASKKNLWAFTYSSLTLRAWLPLFWALRFTFPSFAILILTVPSLTFLSLTPMFSSLSVWAWLSLFRALQSRASRFQASLSVLSLMFPSLALTFPSLALHVLSFAFSFSSFFFSIFTFLSLTLKTSLSS